MIKGQKMPEEARAALRLRLLGNTYGHGKLGKKAKPASESRRELMSRRNGKDQGRQSWYSTRQEYPLELKHFFWLYYRVQRNPEHPGCLWPRTPEGFHLFLAELGPRPTDMKKPVVGRFDHKKPYGPGNVAWQEYSANARIQDHSGRRLRQ